MDNFRIEKIAAEVKPSLLLVDDEEQVLKALMRMTLDEAYTVQTAGSGAEAIAMVKRAQEQGSPFAVVLTDQRMPEMSGAELLAQVKEASPSTMRAILTGYADLSSAIRAINDGGAQRYFSKPWEDSALLASLRELVSFWQLSEENRRLQATVERQNKELQSWNTKLEERVLEQNETIVVKNRKLKEAAQQLTHQRDDLMTTLVTLLENRNPGLASHSRAVQRIAEELSRPMQFSAQQKEQLLTAALLHDIGKLALQDSELVDANGAKARSHAVFGQLLVSAVSGMDEAALYVRHHHERWDGSGAPNGLSGTEIPLGARIIAAADCFSNAIINSIATSAPINLNEMDTGLLDPELLAQLEKLAPELSQDLGGKIAREIDCYGMMRGMVLARPVYSGTGLLLLGTGEVLDDSRIVSIRRFFKLDPPLEQKLLVYQPV